MSRYLVPAFLTVVLIAVLVAVNKGIRFTAEFFSTDAIWGFLAGCIFMGAFVAFVMWVDPSSRPRGSSPSAKHDGSGNLID